MSEPFKTWVLPPVSPAVAGPLYQQIVDGFKREISEGRLQPGQALPSFRALAEELLVSVITVKRAYEELGREGILYRRQGLGTFVSEEGSDRSRQAKRHQARKCLEEAVREGLEAGMKPAELVDLIKSIIKATKV